MLLAAVSLAGFGKVALFLLVLSVLIVLHELGHFVVARRNGVRVNEFAVGMGPKLFGWTSKRSGTLYSLRVLPIGGYCAMQGEDGKTSEAEQQREFLQAGASGTPQSDNFQAKSPWARLAIVLAGPIANFVLCYAILLFGALAFGVASPTGMQPIVGTLIADSPGAKAGIRPGDRIVTVDGRAVTGANLVDTIHQSLGKRLTIEFSRGGATQTVSVTPIPCSSLGMGGIKTKTEKMGCIGFQPVPAFVHVGIGEAFGDSVTEFGNIADQTVGSIAMLVVHFTQYAPQVSGVIGMGQVATTIQDFGWAPYLMLAATISFALGIFNLLPIPALDGGRAAFIIAEIVRGKPIDPEKEAMVHVAGFAALMALMLLVAFHDIARIFSQNGVM